MLISLGAQGYTVTGISLEAFLNSLFHEVFSVTLLFVLVSRVANKTPLPTRMFRWKGFVQFILPKLLLTSKDIQDRNSDRADYLRQELIQRTWKGVADCLDQSVFVYNPGSKEQVEDHSYWTWLSFIAYHLRKCLGALSHGGISSNEVHYLVTLACVRMAHKFLQCIVQYFPKF